ncbi:hypothetical protein [Gymnodinialimonas hymeniacidonis]|uniref:hypothetical protein n=1 Tax=Gymnodinialimonas hymeniacidonis TaxID=3126508 RepID=UPI0034C5BA1A
MNFTRFLGATALALSCAPAAIAETFIVTNPGDSGEGSLRQALADAAATADGVDFIHITTEDDITLAAPLIYDGVDALEIIGHGHTLQATGDFAVLTTTRTTNLTLHRLHLAGTGGYSIEAQGEAGAPGLLIDVPEDAASLVQVFLHGVEVSGTAGHGIHVSDCTLAEDCGGGEGGTGEGSDASIALYLTHVTVRDSGNGRFDADGIRVDERGPGDILFEAIDLEVDSVGADGVELDEGQDGQVVVSVVRGTFSDNGAYCDPALLTPFLPDIPEAEFSEGTTQADTIPAPITGTPDDGCFEREVDLYDDGSVEAFEFSIDVDDGFDIDEAGPGRITASFITSEMTGNYDEGFDFDEAGAGDVEATFLYTLAADNVDDGIKISEAGPGDVVGVVTGSEAIGNTGVGIVFEEEDDGDLQLVILRSSTVGNDGGELGIEAVQDGDGAGFVSVIDTEVADGIEVDGAQIDPD